MYEVSIVIFLLVCAAMVALILVQQGKGAGMGASFGAGASNTVFGSVGSGNFLTRTTWALIIVFFGICLFIGWMQKTAHEQTSSFSNLEAEQTTAAPAPAERAAEQLPLPGDVPVINSDVPFVEETPVQGTAAPAAGAAATPAADTAAAPAVASEAAAAAAATQTPAAPAAATAAETPVATAAPAAAPEASAAATVTEVPAAAASAAETPAATAVPAAAPETPAAATVTEAPAAAAATATGTPAAAAAATETPAAAAAAGGSEDLPPL